VVYLLQYQLTVSYQVGILRTVELAYVRATLYKGVRTLRIALQDEQLIPRPPREYPFGA
jgi:hypothetical protein